MSVIRASRGFTLLEVAVVVLVITLLLGSLLVPLTSQVDQRKTSDTQKSLDEAREALIGFAMSNGRLPCPDTNGDGLEDARTVADAASDGCASGVYVGWLPWGTLGVAQTDAWGNRFKYRVTNEFTRRTGDPTAVAPCAPTGADPNSCTLELTDSGNIQVNVSTKSGVSMATNVPAVVISFGKNGYGATSGDGTAQPAPPAGNLDEIANATATTTTFLSRSMSAPSSTCSDSAVGQPFCEFDDLVVWVPTGILFNRMVAAGKLP
jgi:prepilin-type N-terminal cleavage/methylation domain-containing protein